jgi:hypothetical protein
MKKIKIPDQEHIRMMRASGMSEKDAVTKMASMKKKPMKAPKAGKLSEVSPAHAPGEDYPYGLRINLDHEGMKKLGMKKMPKIGSKHKITAHAHVTSIRESHDMHSKSPDRSLEMQITHMAAEKGEPNPDVENAQDEDNEQGNGLQDQ